jgi:hypothetical protein
MLITLLNTPSLSIILNAQESLKRNKLSESRNEYKSASTSLSTQAKPERRYAPGRSYLQKEINQGIHFSTRLTITTITDTMGNPEYQ